MDKIGNQSIDRDEFLLGKRAQASRNGLRTRRAAPAEKKPVAGNVQNIAELDNGFQRSAVDPALDRRDKLRGKPEPFGKLLLCEPRLFSGLLDALADLGVQRIFLPDGDRLLVACSL